VAFITFCVLALAADNFNFKGTLYEFSNLISVSLTEKIWIDDLLKRYEIGEQPIPEDTNQLEFDF
jgi:hypothetical protein